MTKRRLLILAVLVLAGAGGAAGLLAGRSAAGPFEPIARAQARRLLRQVVVPAGAQRLRVARHADGMLKQAQSTPGARQLVDLHRIWRVHSTLAGAASFVESRLPSGATRESSASAGGPGVPPNEDSSYSLPTSHGMSVRWIGLVFVSLPHGWTGIRADAQVGRGVIRH
jgi:hypothetical protein